LAGKPVHVVEPCLSQLGIFRGGVHAATLARKTRQRGPPLFPRTRTWPSVAALLILAATSAFAAEPLTDAQIREAIVKGSVAAYLATGHPCACPYNLARNGSSCAGRSAYSRPGGAEPLCYPGDVSDGMVADWKQFHQQAR
jgi:hypothetical protein